MFAVDLINFFTAPPRSRGKEVGEAERRKLLQKSALITGITGQDGSYLAEFLLGKGYKVYGVIRRSSSFNTGRIDHIYEDPHETNVHLLLTYGDLNDASSLNKILRDLQPDEIYNLGAQSHVMVSFDIPEYTGEVTALGTIRLLEAIRDTGIKTRFYQASSSEMFGLAQEVPQKETTPFYPRSPYACAKAYAFYTVRNYREAYGLFACNGILFNHESPRRGETFVSRKITRAATRIKVGLQDKLYLGNLEARRDWGYAPEYVEAMWLMLQQRKPDDYVIATGETRSVKEFVEETFRCLGMDWEKHVEIDPRYLRPTEVDLLQGDFSKAEKELGWKPRSRFKDLVRLMVEADLELAKKEAYMDKYRVRPPGEEQRVKGREQGEKQRSDVRDQRSEEQRAKSKEQRAGSREKSRGQTSEIRGQKGKAQRAKSKPRKS